MGVSHDIVLIDDDEDFNEYARRYFATRGISTLTLSDPISVVSVDLSKFKCLLLDIDMPKLSGTDILRGLSIDPRPVVIMVSGKSDRDTRVSHLKMGADQFLAKPVDLEELTWVIERALGRSYPTERSQGQWILDRPAMMITTPDHQEIGLSAIELHILESLIDSTPEVVSKDALFEIAAQHRGGKQMNSTAFEVMISRLRTRASTKEHKLPVKAVRSHGYIFQGKGVII